MREINKNRICTVYWMIPDGNPSGGMGDQAIRSRCSTDVGRSRLRRLMIYLRDGEASVAESTIRTLVLLIIA